MAAKNDKLTTAQVERGFGVTTMTVYLWRKESRPGREPLPYRVLDPSAKRSRIEFSRREIKAWAKRNGQEFDDTRTESVPGKPGRRPQAKPPH